DIAVVTNIGDCDHLGRSYIDTPDQMFTVKRSGVDVVLPTGSAILKADDPLVANMAELCAGRVIFFALDGDHPVIVAHRGQGHRAVFVRDGNVIFADGAHEATLIPVADIPITHGGRVAFQIENALAAAGAAWGLDMAVNAIRTALAQFRGDERENPGRFNVLSSGSATVIVDDCHNTSALAALVAALDGFPQVKRTAVYSAGYGRRDADIVQQGRQLAAAFDRVILYRDPSATDRVAGEIESLFRQGLADGPRVRHIEEIAEQRAAIAAAKHGVCTEDIIFVQTRDDCVAETLSLL